MALKLIGAVAIAFLYVLLDRGLAPFLGKRSPATIYVWAAGLLLLTFAVRGNYVFRLPEDTGSVIGLFSAVLAVNLLIACYSGYRLVGALNRFNFAVVYPVFEEIAFRGLILPLLAEAAFLAKTVRIPGIGELNGAILLTAFLFAVSHLQYYRLNRQSIVFMAFAFSGGLFFGRIAYATEAVLLTIPLHMAFNGAAVFYSQGNGGNREHGKNAQDT
ncbi:CPBP family intramembrane glutamic endopeptidase [Paenibacillus glufosinatiresistens]|uniref:CPBP family intramembrane glutamic endopeptidase n=1 Tax=Paenibacillus glufosinatiresistens TaxID=3070657 RepID=UPI00286DFE06|nr:CPBP family intramembrane glutamic endopeptidase [Paenibacillus sp. YX.27]